MSGPVGSVNRAASGAFGAIISYFTRHRTAANLLLVLMLVGGFFSATQLRSQYLPDFVIETVTVNVVWPGAGPEDVDRAIVGVIEPRMLAIEGVVSTSATASEGSARIIAEFEEGWDMGQATDEVKSAIDAISNLPDSAEDPIVQRGRYRDRVTDVVIHGPVETDQLTRFAQEFQEELFQNGVTRTSIRGGHEPIIRVDAPEAALIRHDVALSDIASAIAAGTEANPAGDVSAGATRIRTGEERRSAEEIAEIVVRTDADGSRLLVRDVAEVRSFGVEEGVAFFRGDNPAVTIRVDRSESGDAIKLQALVQRIADDFASSLPAGVEIQLTRVRAEAISQRLNILLENAAYGLALVLLFLFLFLSARTAFWVAMGIPAAFACAVAFMYISGITLNMVSLFALIICLGIVVDDAIVVSEHADFMAERRGLGPAEAAETGATRMMAPVFSATVTTVIAFAGITFVEGRFGTLIRDVPLTVCAVLIASLIEAFIILPAHMNHALSGKKKERWYDAPSRAFNRGFNWVRDKAFRPLIRWTIHARYLVLGGSIAAILLTSILFIDGTVKWRFWNAPEVGTVDANIAMLPGGTREDTIAQLREMQRALDVVAARFREEHEQEPLEYSLAKVGGNAGWRGLSGSDAKDKDLLGGLSVTLIDPDLRSYTQWEFIRSWQAEIRSLPTLETLSIRGGRSGPGGDAIDIKFAGPEAEILKAAAEEAKARLAQFGAVSALEDSLAYDKGEAVLTLTPKGEAMGLSTERIGRELRDRLSGIEAAEYLLNGRNATVRVSLPEDELTADYLERALIRTPDGGYAALSEVVEVRTQFGFSAIRREDGTAVIRVSGDVSEDDPTAAAEVQAAIRDVIIPEVEARHDVKAEIAGLAEQERGFLEDSLRGFVVCVIGVYLVLVWIFASWTRPLVIVLAIPFGIIGTLWGHHWNEIPLTMFSIVGLLGMAGIIVNDSIVLVSTVDEYAKRRALFPALVEATADRLRPVLLTTITTVVGLMPLLYEQSQQAQFLKPTVVTLVFGLSFGMILVLFVTPAMIAIQKDVGDALRSARRMASLAVRRRRGLGAAPKIAAGE
ncbi:MAG: efflux RND transporter permease subunit [Pseudomonadota bacterium]